MKLAGVGRPALEAPSPPHVWDDRRERITAQKCFAAAGNRRPSLARLDCERPGKAPGSKRSSREHATRMRAGFRPRARRPSMGARDWTRMVGSKKLFAGGFTQRPMRTTGSRHVRIWRAPWQGSAFRRVHHPATRSNRTVTSLPARPRRGPTMSCVLRCLAARAIIGYAIMAAVLEVC